MLPPRHGTMGTEVKFAPKQPERKRTRRWPSRTLPDPWAKRDGRRTMMAMVLLVSVTLRASQLLGGQTERRRRHQNICAADALSGEAGLMPGTGATGYVCRWALREAVP